jgi:hypothetical protein
MNLCGCRVSFGWAMRLWPLCPVMMATRSGRFGLARDVSGKDDGLGLPMRLIFPDLDDLVGVSPIGSSSTSTDRSVIWHGPGDALLGGRAHR